MRRLILLRHAKTEADAPSGRDHDRRLDERGIGDAAEIGGWLASQKLVPDAVLVSDATRTRQTWDLVAAEFATTPSVSHLPELYGAGPTQLLQAIRDAGEPPARLLVIGHNPGLHELAIGLIGRDDADGRRALNGNLPTAGAVVIDFPIDDWGDVAFNSGKLAHFVTPKILRT
jgi:phosphohistidine phosphatase